MKNENLGCVYFFRHLGLSPVKIGYSESESPTDRFCSFKTYAPYGAEMIGFVQLKNAKEIETQLHKKYSKERLNGEWFNITLEDVEKEIKFYSDTYILLERSFFWEKFAINKKQNIEDESNKVDESFVIFIESLDLKKIIVNRKDFKNQYKIFSNKEITPQKFNKQVKHYCLSNGITFKERKFNGSMQFLLNC